MVVPVDGGLMSDEARAAKAALLLARVMCAHYEGQRFSLVENGVTVQDGGRSLLYEGREMAIGDVISGSLILVHGLITDLAEHEGTSGIDLARLVELTTAMADAVEFPEDFVPEHPSRRNV